MAIAFDAGTQGGFTSGTSHTFTHTVTGSDRLLFVHGFKNASSDTLNSCTYNGVSATLITSITPASSRRVYLWYLIAPSTGSNTVAVGSSSSTAIGANAVSYTGAQQSGVPDAQATASSSTTPSVTSVTTVADNCWAVLAVIGNNANSTASTNSTLRASNATYGDGDTYDNNGAITPAGSYSMTVTHAGVAPLARIIASFAPASGGGGGGSTVNALFSFGGF